MEVFADVHKSGRRNDRLGSPALPGRTAGLSMLEWTGERYVPWMEGAEIGYEHLHRYAFATQFVRNKRVLDLASGEGYGSNLLAKTAKQVVGVDIDEQTEIGRRRVGKE